jgi:hypothetical protein
MALLLFLGALGTFKLGEQRTFESQEVDRYGVPFGRVKTIGISNAERVGFRVIGGVCLGASVFLLARISRDRDK